MSHQEQHGNIKICDEDILILKEQFSAIDVQIKGLKNKKKQLLRVTGISQSYYRKKCKDLRI